MRFYFGMSYVDHKFTVRQTLEKCAAKNKEIGMIFVNLEKVYESVSRKKFMECFRKN